MSQIFQEKTNKLFSDEFKGFEFTAGDQSKVFKPSDGLSKFIPLSFNENGKDINFIGDDNFVAITKYNISHFYAMAVYYLSQELKT